MQTQQSTPQQIFEASSHASTQLSQVEGSHLGASSVRMSVETKPSAPQPSSECTSSDLQPLQQKLLSGNVGLTPSGRAIPFTRAHTLYVSSLRICTVSSRLQSFVASNLHPHWQIRALEAGGGGDCLFHSVGAGLEALFFSGLPGASDHVLRVLPDFHQLSSKVDMMF